MNIIELDILKTLFKIKLNNQRELLNLTNYSLGTVNKSLNNLIKDKFIDKEYNVTNKGKNFINKNKPERAIILAAGYGMRMIPINMNIPKGLLNVFGETLIERQIHQLHDAGIYEIYVVVGFMKESFEYLIDKYNVKLIVNDMYSEKNSYYSLFLAREYLKNAYIIPCDVWCKTNPFSNFELYSWYMVKDSMCTHTNVRVNRNQELIHINLGDYGNNMVGISYIKEEDSSFVCNKLYELNESVKYFNSYYEEALYKKNKMICYSKIVKDDEVIEINTYEQLRDLDGNSEQVQNDAISEICKSLSIKSNEIKNIKCLKKGMTNRSFLFSYKDEKYIMRIPGEGTDKLINRKEEAKVYQVLRDKHISDDIIYINPNNGYKITKYLDNARVCDINNEDDIRKCMDKLRTFHNLKLKVNHYFDLFEKINFYESLWNGKASLYADYMNTKKHVFELKEYIDKHVSEYNLTHIDAVPDNFLFTKNGDIRLIDWEYAAMQDQSVDIAMFAIYALYNKEQIDKLIDIYYLNNCSKETRIKIYCYVAVCGLLWSNWCEYKHQLGVEFGEYSLCQYRYAKEYYRYAILEMESL